MGMNGQCLVARGDKYDRSEFADDIMGMNGR